MGLLRWLRHLLGQASKEKVGMADQMLVVLKKEKENNNGSAETVISQAEGTAEGRG